MRVGISYAFRIRRENRFQHFQRLFPNGPPACWLMGREDIAHLLSDANGGMQGDKRLLRDRSDAFPANALELDGVDLRQILAFKTDNSLFNSPVCAEYSEECRGKRALAGSRFTQHSQCLAALDGEAHPRERSRAFTGPDGVCHGKIQNLQKGLHAKLKALSPLSHRLQTGPGEQGTRIRGQSNSNTWCRFASVYCNLLIRTNCSRLET